HHSGAAATSSTASRKRQLFREIDVQCASTTSGRALVLEKQGTISNKKSRSSNLLRSHQSLPTLAISAPSPTRSNSANFDDEEDEEVEQLSTGSSSRAAQLRRDGAETTGTTPLSSTCTVKEAGTGDNSVSAQRPNGGRVTDVEASVAAERSRSGTTSKTPHDSAVTVKLKVASASTVLEDNENENEDNIDINSEERREACIFPVTSVAPSKTSQPSPLSQTLSTMCPSPEESVTSSPMNNPQVGGSTSFLTLGPITGGSAAGASPSSFNFSAVASSGSSNQAKQRNLEQPSGVGVANFSNLSNFSTRTGPGGPRPTQQVQSQHQQRATTASARQSPSRSSFSIA
ncbi:unnamed protein product, partial [Amoebophrya sp. A120]